MVSLKDIHNQELPISNIYGIGRNYAAHAKELGNAVPAEPLVFMKSTAALGPQSGEASVSDLPEAPHHEVEMVLWLKEHGRIGAVGVGVDMTLRSVQNRCKEQGHPWTWAKSFRGSALCSRLVPFNERLNLANLDLKLWLDGELRQNGNTRDMLTGAAGLVSFLSSKIPLLPGDLIFTGTPAGVGPLRAGQELKIQLGEIAQASWKLV